MKQWRFLVLFRLRRSLLFLKHRAFEIWFLLAVYIAVANPLDLAGGSDGISERIALGFRAHFYNMDLTQRVTVVLFDDASADAFNPGKGYPAPLGVHGEILRTILCEQPRAVFVDLFFRFSRDEVETADLAEGVRHRRAAAECAPLEPGEPGLKVLSPLFLAMPPPTEGDCDFLYGRTGKYCGDAALADVYRVSTLVPMAATVDDSRYPLVAIAEAPDGTKLRGYTPAPRLYDEVCRDPGFAPGCVDRPGINRFMTDGFAAGEPAKLALQWGTIAAPSQGGCEPAQAPAGWLTRLGRALSFLLMETVGDLARLASDTQKKGLCMPVDTVSAAELLRYLSSAPESAAELIRNRVVLYGVKIEGIPDIAVSDVVGTVPAVMTHAMALDNMLRFGNDYWTDPPEFAGLPLDRWLEIVLLCLLLAAHRLAASRFGAFRRPLFAFAAPAAALQARQASAARQGWQLALAGVGIVAVTTISCAALFCWAPINWLGILTYAGLALALAPGGNDR